jgi:DNA polymerase/3'-5' exonuclease PolX
MTLATAQKYAAQIVEWLLPNCERIEIAGSIRRQRPEVNDIDIVCIPKQTVYTDMFKVETGRQNHLWMFLINYVNNHPSRNVVASVATGERVRIIQGDQPGCKQMIIQLPKVQLDLWFADESNFASRLLMRTGSKEHNIWFAQRAQDRGGKWNPYEGLWLNNRRLPAATEADLYTALGVSPVDPINRELHWVQRQV